jgi:hypothetical protein
MHIIRILITSLPIIFSYSIVLAFSCQTADNKVLFDNETWYGEVSTTTLSVIASKKNAKNMKLIADTPTHLGKMTDLICDKKNASWYYPKLGIKIY